MYRGFLKTREGFIKEIGLEEPVPIYCVCRYGKCSASLKQVDDLTWDDILKARSEKMDFYRVGHSSEFQIALYEEK